jgi:hypothetical protein
VGRFLQGIETDKPQRRSYRLLIVASLQTHPHQSSENKSHLLADLPSCCQLPRIEFPTITKREALEKFPLTDLGSTSQFIDRNLTVRPSQRNLAQLPDIYEYSMGIQLKGVAIRD